MSWIDWLPPLLSWLTITLVGAGVFVGRHWIKAWIDNRVELQGQRALEKYRAELNAEKEQIVALRQSVLSGQSSRQAMVDQRRIEAVSHVWEAVNELAGFRLLAGMLQSMNIEVAGSHAPTDSKIQEFAAALLATAGNLKPLKNPAKNAEPFVSPEAWAFYKAYETIATMAFSVLSAMEKGVDPNKLLKLDDMAKLAEATLPHHAKLFDKYGFSFSFFLLDEIKQKLLTQLRYTLQGKEADQEQLYQSMEITRLATVVLAASQESGVDVRIPEGMKSKPAK